MAAAAPIFTAAGAAVPDSAFRRGAGRCAAAAARAAAGGGDFFSTMAGTTATATATTAAPTPSALAFAAAPPPLASQRVVAEYIYLGGSGTDLRSVTRVVELKPAAGAGPGGTGGAAGTGAAGSAIDVSALPLIAVNGSSSNQPASSNQSALFLKPRSAWPDPLRGGGALLVLCEAYSPPPVDAAGGGGIGGGGLGIRTCSPLGDTSENQNQNHKQHHLAPHQTNNRVYAERAARAAAREEPLFAITQQYLLCEADGTPLGECPAEGEGGSPFLFFV